MHLFCLDPDSIHSHAKMIASLTTAFEMANSRKELVWRLCAGSTALCGPVATVDVRHALPCSFFWRIANVNLAHNHPPLDVPRATSMLLINYV